MTNTNVLMGDTVIICGASYVITDEPVYVRAYDDKLMIQWVLEPVPAGPATGLLQGPFNVWPNEYTNVVRDV